MAYDLLSEKLCAKGFCRTTENDAVRDQTWLSLRYIYEKSFWRFSLMIPTPFLQIFTCMENVWKLQSLLSACQVEMPQANRHNASQMTYCCFLVGRKCLSDFVVLGNSMEVFMVNYSLLFKDWFTYLIKIMLWILPCPHMNLSVIWFLKDLNKKKLGYECLMCVFDIWAGRNVLHYQ